MEEENMVLTPPCPFISWPLVYDLWYSHYIAKDVRSNGWPKRPSSQKEVGRVHAEEGCICELKHYKTIMRDNLTGKDKGNIRLDKIARCAAEAFRP